ncbi:MAG: hypothetical protein PHV68_01285, partial [Candidatus Gastranaerophilales bacterium]|nr:hypothetical protein [Candidatus Gastranaerophilales bacterium]
YEMESISSEYTAKISDTNLYVQNGNGDGTASWNQLDSTSLDSAGYTILYRDADGVLGDCDATDKEAIENGVKKGSYVIYKTSDCSFDADGKFDELKQEGGVDPTAVSIGSTTDIKESLDTSNDAIATAEYETQMNRVEAIDKKMELELNNVDTQHKAVQTEVEAVKKVIQKNIETSFKTFSA